LVDIIAVKLSSDFLDKMKLKSLKFNQIVALNFAFLVSQLFRQKLRMPYSSNYLRVVYGDKMPIIIKGLIQCYGLDLLELQPEKYFCVQPLKWETGSDSADTGDMTPDQDFSWAEFTVEGFIPSSIIKLPLEFPDNEWNIFDIEMISTDKDFMRMLERNFPSDIPALSNSDIISGEIVLDEKVVKEKIAIKRDDEVIWRGVSEVPVIDGTINIDNSLFIR